MSDLLPIVPVEIPEQPEPTYALEDLPIQVSVGRRIHRFDLEGPHWKQEFEYLAKSAKADLGQKVLEAAFGLPKHMLTLSVEATRTEDPVTGVVTFVWTATIGDATKINRPQLGSGGPSV